MHIGEFTKSFIRKTEMEENMGLLNLFVKGCRAIGYTNAYTRMSDSKDIVKLLREFKVDGQSLFSKKEIKNLFRSGNYRHLAESGKFNYENISMILNNPSEIEWIQGCRSKGYGLFRAVLD